MFEIEVAALGSHLAFRADSRKPDRHGYVEPSSEMPLDDYQSALFRTAPDWKEWRLA
ncbi:MAG: hypothetical protein FJ087_02010 [Deltaproteobacteria bacterium]|nr:hypothetical protein [Deltaproteobacteria bacterium]